ncbi:MAG: hypothetical protein DMG88_02315 [Acidobacteria bacterium]|nr:MAG: hypothetical protein DMG88_02315 [Acidobacteriota bacterium]
MVLLGTNDNRRAAKGGRTLAEAHCPSADPKLPEFLEPIAELSAKDGVRVWGTDAWAFAKKLLYFFSWPT